MNELQLREIVAELVTRPGHEKVRGNLLRLLTDGLGASSTDITFEQQLNRFRVRGRIDALLGRTLFEVKSDLRREKRDADRQLETYLRDREAETKEPWVGVATDGADFFVAILRDNKLTELGTFKPKPEEPRGMLAWLESVVVLNVELPPDVDRIRTELGRDSIHYRQAMKELEDLWDALTDNPEAILKRDLWNRLLRVAYGADIGAPDLFLQHTYLTIVAKSIATAALIDNLPPTGAALLAGQAFRDLGIVGAIESDFFDWLLLDPAGDELVMEIVQHVNRFRLRDIETDVLKGLYESLIDPAQRHDLGEYYTPDWLAERVCAATIDDPMHQRVIDPACGSGTFLFHAVRRALAAAGNAKAQPAEAVALACEKIAGVDVHPVAVIFARATYLLALMPSLAQGRPSSVSVPVYLGDSLQWNAREFMNQRDLEIIVPATGESAATAVAEEDDSQRIILRFPASVAADPGLFDASLQEMLNLAERKQPASVVEAWLRRHSITADADVHMLVEAYGGFLRLQHEGRNHIWGYVARNLSRPIWLASEKQKADVVIGNPPWLAYRAMNKPTQKRFMDEMKASALWGKLSSVSGYDLSAYFFARSVQLYMRQTGKIAFLLPYAAMTRKPYALFRKGVFKLRHTGDKDFIEFTDAWALPADVQPLFPVPACVIFARRAAAPTPLPAAVLFFSGRLPRRDAHADEARRSLRERRDAWPGETDEGGESPYQGRFRNGAVLWPRRLIIVTEAAQGRLGGNPAAPIVEGRVTNLDKKPWNEVAAIHGPVERKFLKRVYLGESIAPYRLLQPVIGIIPVEPKSHHLMDAQAAAARGYGRLAAMLAGVETTWATHSKQARTFIQQIDFFGNLSGQYPIAPLRVVYTKTGRNLAGTVLRDAEAIAENGLYWAATETEDEAYYLAAILNSETTRARAEKWQATGQWGARHFDKVIFNLPIPVFNHRQRLHRDLAAAARRSETIAAAVALKEGEYFTTARKRIRNELIDDGVAVQIESMVGTLLGG